MTGSQKKDNDSYKSILRGSSVFGGLQVFLILINLIRGKFVAMFLGPEGMGISSLFTSASNTIVKASSLGLNLAIVKEVAHCSEKPEEFRRLLPPLRLLLRLTALAGALFCLLFSGTLSRLTFHSSAYSWQFMLLSVAIFLTVEGNGRLSVLQGLHEVRKMSAASLAGALAGLVAGVPLYYFFGDKGIVPAIVILSLTLYIFYSVPLRKLPETPRFNRHLHLPVIKRLVLLGLVLLAGDLIGTLCTYLLNLYLRSAGDLDTVGLYQAANSVTAQYSGAIFTALSLDYFPRLSKAADDNARMRTVVNRQSEVVALSIAPLASLLILTAPLVIRLLLTDEFLPVLPLMRWMGLGVMLRALQFPMGYIAFAKENRRLFFILEGIVTNILFLGGGVLFFRLFGLIGMGYAMVAESVISLAIYSVVNFRAYGYRFSRAVSREYLVCALLCGACFLFSAIPGTVLPAALMSVVVIMSVTYSFLRLRALLRTSRQL